VLHAFINQLLQAQNIFVPAGRAFGHDTTAPISCAASGIFAHNEQV